MDDVVADLTPIGAEKAGNKDGTIPAWTGGLCSPPAGWTPAQGYTDPFASDKVLFTITKANAAQYKDNLTPGTLAMLAKYPEFKMNVYQTRRTACYPQEVYDAVKAQAGKIELQGFGIANRGNSTSPFPIPKNGMEAIWNHTMRYLGGGIDRNYGLITVGTKTMEIGKERNNIPTYMVPGNYIILKVADTGSGIPKEIINRIFDPFFTTKEKGKGTGLGLATVYGIVKDHKGFISVESEKGKGSAFSIYFPVPEKITLQREEPKIISMSGYENILLVDDDVDVLNFLREILEGHGYSVLPVSNSLNAIDIFRSNSETIQIVVTDIMMPLMEGNELIKYLKRIKPDIKIIVISGYSNTAVSKDKLVDAFIKKPFESMELLSSVRRLLDTGSRKLPLY